MQMCVRARVQMRACVCGLGLAGAGGTLRCQAAWPAGELHSVPGLSRSAGNSGARANRLPALASFSRHWARSFFPDRHRAGGAVVGAGLRRGGSGSARGGSALTAGGARGGLGAPSTERRPPRGPLIPLPELAMATAKPWKWLVGALEGMGAGETKSV